MTVQGDGLAVATRRAFFYPERLSDGRSTAEKSGVGKRPVSVLIGKAGTWMLL
jgi:hypothetical protein